MQFFLVMIFATLPFSVFQLFAVSTYGFTLLDFFSLMMFFLFLKYIIWDGKSMRIGFHPALIFFVLFVIGVLLSSFHPLTFGSNELIVQYFKTSAHLAFLLLLPIIAMVYPIETKAWNNAIKAWLIVSIFINIFGVYQIVARAYDLPFAWVKATSMSLSDRGRGDMDEYYQLSLSFGSFFRATSIFSEPSGLAGYNLSTLAFLIAPAMHNTKSYLKSRFLNIVAFVTAFAGTFLAFSMTGFMGIMIFAFAILIFKGSKKFGKLVLIVISSIVLILITDYFVEKYADISVINLFQDRIEGIVSGPESNEGIAGESYGSRIDNASQMIALWERFPVVGAGLGCTEYYGETEYAFSDNTLFAALAETGIIGTTAFTMMFLLVLFATVRLQWDDYAEGKYDDNDKRLFYTLFYISLPLFFTTFITSNNLVNFPLWIMLTLIFSGLNAFYLKQGSHVYNIRLFRIPVKNYLGRFISTLPADVKK